MDYPDNIETAVEWFVGCGGNHIGLKRVLPRLRVLAACEIEAYAVANMVQKMEVGLLDPFPIWSDCRTFPCELFRGLVDLFIASYPCQGFSAAGQRKGQADPRFLWPWVLRAVAIIQPRRVFFENVYGHVSLGLSTVLADLAEAGYKTTWGLFSAEECGAPQIRKRVFILGERKAGKIGVGYAVREQTDWNNFAGVLDQSRGTSCALGNSQGFAEREPADSNDSISGRGEARNELGIDGELANASSSRCRRRENSGADSSNAGADGSGCSQLERGSSELANTSGSTCNPRSERTGRQTRSDDDRCCSESNVAITEHDLCGTSGTNCSQGGSAVSPFATGQQWPARPGQPQFDWEPPRTTQPGLGRSAPGISDRVDRLRLLGNSVVPDTAELAWKTLYARLNSPF